MAYTKQNFTDGQILKAEHLNTIETQVAKNETDIAKKLDKNQGTSNAGKAQIVNSNGNAVPAEVNTLGGKPPEYYMRYENLLDNSNFLNIVNQRGQIVYSGTSGYKIDRWRGAATILWGIVPDIGQSLNNEGSGVAGITQYLEIGRRPIPGEKVTLACETLAGDIYCGTVTTPESGQAKAFTSEDGSFYGGVYYGEEGRRVQFMLQPGTSATLKWIALYRGSYTKETLPPYIPKEYGRELLECQRYYWQSKGYYTAYGYTVGTANIYLTLNLPVTMQKKPNIKLTNATLTVRGIDDSTHSGITIDSVLGMHGNTVRVLAVDPNASLLPNRVVTATVSETNGILEAIAEDITEEIVGATAEDM